MRDEYHLACVGRVMQTLDQFSADTPELRLTDLSDRLALPKPQVLRIASTLESGGYLERDPVTKRYRLGLRLFQLGMLVREELDLRRVARPQLLQLAGATLETVGLIVVDPTGPICVDVIESPKGVRVYGRVGRHMPWNAGTSGKVILAYLPDEQREHVLATVKFRRYTPRTVIDPDLLRPVLEEIRAAGYQVSALDLDDDAIGVAAPLFDHDGAIVGAFSLAGPSSRISEHDLQNLVAAVRTAAAEVSRKLGYRTHPVALASAADD